MTTAFDVEVSYYSHCILPVSPWHLCDHYQWVSLNGGGIGRGVSQTILITTSMHSLSGGLEGHPPRRKNTKLNKEQGIGCHLV